MSGTTVIQHNMQAMFGSRQLGVVTGTLAKSSEKLSSGYRINRAADDAAGLSISEKMRRQIRGTHQGTKNIQDGISFCNIADGALNEVHDMLNRVEELSVKAANGTNQDVDREYIDSEVQNIMEEINRIGTTTVFNEIPVFTGGTSSALVNPTAKSAFFKLLGDDVSHTGYMQEALPFSKIQSLLNATPSQATGAHNNGGNDYVGVHCDFDKLINQNNDIQSLVGKDFYINCCTNCCPRQIKFVDDSGITSDGNTISVGVKDASGNYFTDAEEFNKSIINSPDISGIAHVEFAYEGSMLYMYDIDNNEWNEYSKKLAYFCDMPKGGVMPTETGSGLIIQMGADRGNEMEIYTGSLNTDVLGLLGTNCLTPEDACLTMEALHYAGEALSRQRGHIGALVNRMEHAVNINNITEENTQAAESLIRDTDMSDEMVRYSNMNILRQAGESLLAQANQSKQGVLELLQ